MYLKQVNLEHSIFLEARANYITWCNDPGNLGKRCQHMDKRQRQVVSSVGVEEYIEEPDEELIELATWQEENQQYRDPKTGGKADPGMAGLTILTRETANGRKQFVKVQIGKAGHLGRINILYMIYTLLLFSIFNIHP